MTTLKTSETSSHSVWRRVGVGVVIPLVAVVAGFGGYLYGNYREATRLAQWQIVLSSYRIQCLEKSPQAIAEQFDMDAFIALKDAEFSTKHPWRYLAGSFFYAFPGEERLKWRSDHLRPAAARYAERVKPIE